MKKILALSLLSLASAAQAQAMLFSGTFAPEATGATGTGTLLMTYNPVARTLDINATWSGLSGNTSTAHIHCCTPAANTGTSGVALAQGSVLPGFPLGVNSGNYIRSIDLTQSNQYNATFLTNSGGTVAQAEARLISNLNSGNAYFNIHSSAFTGGEIRAFVTVVPEPSTYALMGLGLAAVAGAASRRRRQQA